MSQGKFSPAKTRISLLVLIILAIGIFVIPTSANGAENEMEFRWNYEESSGNAILNSAGGGGTGTLYGGASRVAAHEGNGIELDGINDYIQSTSPSADLGIVNKPYALSTWVKVATGETSGNIIHVSGSADGTG